MVRRSQHHGPPLRRGPVNVVHLLVALPTAFRCVFVGFGEMDDSPQCVTSCDVVGVKAGGRVLMKG